MHRMENFKTTESLFRKWQSRGSLDGTQSLLRILQWHRTFYAGVIVRNCIALSSTSHHQNVTAAQSVPHITVGCIALSSTSHHQNVTAAHSVPHSTVGCIVFNITPSECDSCTVRTTHYCKLHCIVFNIPPSEFYSCTLRTKQYCRLHCLQHPTIRMWQLHTPYHTVL
jgi:hypothetical protein